jgi:hypothetical protein
MINLADRGGSVDPHHHHQLDLRFPLPVSIELPQQFLPLLFGASLGRKCREDELRIYVLIAMIALLQDINVTSLAS